MNVCLPYLTLEDIMDKLNTKYWYSTMQDKDEQQYVDAIETLISESADTNESSSWKQHDLGQ